MPTTAPNQPRTSNGGRPRKNRPPSAAIRVPRALADQIRFVCSQRHIATTDYVESILAGPVAQDARAEHQRFSRAIERAGNPRSSTG